MLPVDVFRLTPAGSGGETDQTTGGTPSGRCNVIWYTWPSAALGDGEVVVIIGGGGAAQRCRIRRHQRPKRRARC